ncbi:TIR domain-containing protein [Methanobacterium alcaliphilum]|uniref:TIR domain-containing protein n=1 Tax=Methanobacterium alcaliphilum TaxID=392018 RepID=UPI00200A8F11|nr:TIR domain-containing protein [Methanobacterium alcaliphilum]MCK9151701.1 hypothetical protein [Methanobacterium alcaliphilum]
MFEDEMDKKTYRLFISQTPQDTKEFSQFLERLESSHDFIWENNSQKEKVDPEILFEQIEKSEVVVILSGIYSIKKELIENIFSIALKQDKPIVLIRPYGMENVPLELEEKSDAVIGWNAHCIVGAIKGVLGLGDDEELGEID